MAALAGGLPGHRSLGGQHLLSFASLLFLGLYLPLSCLFVVVSSYTFLLLLKLSSPEPTTFLPFRLPLLPLHPTEEERASSGVVLSCPPGLNRNNL